MSNSNRKLYKSSQNTPGLVSFASPSFTPMSTTSTNFNSALHTPASAATVQNSKRRESHIRNIRKLNMTPGTQLETHTNTNTNLEDSFLLQPHSQTISESLLAMTDSASRELEKIWDQVGLTPEERAQELTDLLQQLHQTCQLKVEHESMVRDNFQKQITEHRQEIKETCDALRIAPDQDLLEEKKDMTLQDVSYTLELALEELRNVANASRQDLSVYKSQLEEYCEALGITLEAEFCDIESDLTVKAVQKFQQKVQEVEMLVQNRIEAVVTLLKDAKSLIDDLHLNPMDHLLDRKICSSLQEQDGKLELVDMFESDDCTGISSGTLDALTERIRELHDEKERRRQELTAMGEVISDLWDKLQVSKEERLEFTQECTKAGLSLQTLDMGKKEITRLNEMKEAMMGDLIVEARQRIKELWIQTNATPQQQQAFVAMNVQDETLINDGLLQEHEDLIEELGQKLEEMRPLLDLIQKREAIIQERMELEKFHKDPSRLQQRGAVQQLMKEEKMTNRVNKLLPKYSDHLNRKLKEWQKSHGEPFVYKGEDYLVKMKQQDEEWYTYKENQAQAKREKKQMERSSYSTKPRSASSTRSVSSAPLRETTNKRSTSNARPKSRFRALSRGRVEEGPSKQRERDAARSKSRPRLFGRARSKSRAPSRTRVRPVTRA